ncbi:MAG: hypothetical protein UY97_C0002G0041 [Parcubacteria group bacterium GW2011_GWB1_57_6]|nr:MAG: hypothetical protein UY97_C0002G0041 [Parcubacteria group bacterium GW2011_GWB1_57_6]
MEKSESGAWGIHTLESCIDRTTMYRLGLYYVLALFASAVIFSTVGALPYAPAELLWSAGVFLAASWLANMCFARICRAVTNAESVYITALILALIVTPTTFSDITGSSVLAVIAVLAMASKYVLAIGKKHLFNPAAAAVVISGFVFGLPASWWAAEHPVLLPFIIVGGLLIVRKLRTYDLVLAFATAALAVTALLSSDLLAEVRALFLESAFFYFGFVMLTEPLTMPPTRALRIGYGALVGAFFVPVAHIGSFYFSPELALVTGNLFSYIVSPKGRYMLSFIGRRPLASGIHEYLFRSDRPLRFRAGQYLEWTIRTLQSDARGNRRFFTIASAPEDETLALGVRFYERPSAFKRALAKLLAGAVVSTSSPAGDFTMPKDTQRKLALIAGGIGVTPFASMARHCIAASERRDAVLLYASRTSAEVAYQDVFARAAGLGWRAVYAVSEEVPASSGVRTGTIDAAFIKREVADYHERIFYISGPPGMVDGIKRILRGLGISRFSIKTDFFPGLV